jgi:opacity protein-like surface antigen
MKTATVIVALILALAAIGGPAMAQGTKAIGAGLDVALPTGNFGDAANTGFGGVVSFSYGVTPNINVLADFGYTRWSAKNSLADLDINWSAIPVQFGAKYYPLPMTNRFYLGALAGFHRFSIDVPFYNPSTGTTTTISASDTKFGVAPMAGYELGIGAGMALDLGARYQYVSDELSYFGVRAGLVYNLK